MANVAAAAPSDERQTKFDVQALGATGATEFTLEIDGQSLRWKGQPQTWVHMLHPNATPEPGCRITAITPDGRSVVIFNEPGRTGLRRMVDTAKRERMEGGIFKLSWENSGVVVSLNLKIIGTQQPAAPVRAAANTTAGFKNLKLPESIIGAAPPANATAMPAAAGGAQ